MGLRIIGDVHGKIDQYKIIANKAEYSVQVGDMGFDYSGLADLDSSRHKFFGGNHDNMDIYYDTPHALGDFGQACLGNVEFFYVRGAFSIDKKYRVAREFSQGKSWWEEEELSYKKGEDMLSLYDTLRPEVVLTHTCPYRISKMIGNPEVLRAFGFDPDTYNTSTQALLDSMLDIHFPKIWIFGHFHKNLKVNLGGTNFYCLAELNFMDLTENI